MISTTEGRKSKRSYMSFAWTKVMQTKIWLLNGKRLVAWIICRNALFWCFVSSTNCSGFFSPLCCSLAFRMMQSCSSFIRLQASFL
jgi:hypothetical protein